MNIHLKILDHYPQEHSITFRYYTDIIDEEFLAVHDGQGNINRRSDGSPERCRTDTHINIFDNAITSAEDVKNYIAKNSPPNLSWFQLQESLHKKELEASNQVLSTLNGQKFSFTAEDFNNTNNEVDIEKLLEQLLEPKLSTSNGM